jgi:hypothetical protein
MSDLFREVDNGFVAQDDEQAALDAAGVSAADVAAYCVECGAMPLQVALNGIALRKAALANQAEAQM